MVILMRAKNTHKRKPPIDPRRKLACLPQRHILIEFGHDSVDNCRRDQDNQEGREHPVLHIDDRVAKLPEGEAVKDADDDRREQLAVDVRRIAPLLYKYAFSKHCSLQPDRSSELRLLLSILRGWSLLTSFAFDALNLLQYFFGVV